MSDNLKYVDFSGDFKKYLNTRPVSVCCFKREESVEDWSDVFVAVCRGLYMHHPLRFDKTTGSHKFQAIISRSERKLLCPRQFSQLRYCETDLSLPEILGWIRQLADGLGVRYELIQIQVQELPPETLENCTQAERCRWICDGIERLRRHGNVLDFEFDVPSYVYAYTKPVSLTVRTTDGLFQTGTPFDKLCYQFDNWQDIVERIMAWMTLIDAEFLVDGLKHDCDAAITKAISFSYTQMKRPFLLHEHEYIDLEVFDNHIVLCIETLCAIADRAELTPNDLRITFEIDEEKLNSMLAEEADGADDAAEVDDDEVDEDEVDEDEVDEDESDEDEVDEDEVDEDDEDDEVDDVDGDKYSWIALTDNAKFQDYKDYLPAALVWKNECIRINHSWNELFDKFYFKLLNENQEFAEILIYSKVISVNPSQYKLPYAISDTEFFFEGGESGKLLSKMAVIYNVYIKEMKEDCPDKSEIRIAFISGDEREASPDEFEDFSHEGDVSEYDEVDASEYDEVDASEYDEVDASEYDEVDDDEVDDDEVDESDELEESQIRLVKKYYEFTLANDNWEAYAEDQVTAYQDKKVNSWPEVFEAFCDELYEIEGKSLIHKFKNDGLIHRNYDEYHRPYQIGDTGYYIETEREVLKMLKLMSILCDELEIDKDSICIGTSAMVEVDEDEVDDDEVDDDEVDDDEVDDDEVDDDEVDEDEVDEDEVDDDEVDDDEVCENELDDDEIDEDDDEAYNEFEEDELMADGTILVNWDGDLDRYADTKLVKFNIDGTEESSDSWDDLIIGFCKPKYDALKELDDALWQSIDRRYMNKSHKELKKPHIVGYKVCIELELQAHEILKMLKQIMEILGEDCQKLQIYVCRDTSISVYDGLGVSCTSTPKQQTVAQNYVVRRVYDPSQPMDANNRVAWNNHNPYGNAANLNSVDSEVMQVDFEHLNSSKYEYSEPVYLSCFDKTNYRLETWKDVLVNVVKEVYAKFGKLIFINAHANWKIASQVDGDLIGTRKLRFPKEIAKNIYIESNYSTEEILRIIKALMDFRRISYEEVIIRYMYKNIPKRAPKGSVNRLSSHVNNNERRTSYNRSGNHRTSPSVEKPNSCRIVDSYRREFVLPAAGTAKLSPIDLGKKHVPRKSDEKLLAVLRQACANGYSLESFTARKRFAKNYEKIHGEECSVADEALDLAIKQVSFVIGDQCFAVDSVFDVENSKKLLSFVEETLNREDVPCLWYEAIFEHFGNYHKKTLKNSETLIRYLAETATTKYHYYPDFCAKDVCTEVPNLVQILEAYLRERGEKSSDELCEAFDYVPKALIESSLGQNKETFVSESRDGRQYWSLMDMVDLSEADVEEIANALEEALQDSVGISWNELIECLEGREAVNAAEFLQSHENNRDQVLNAKLGQCFKFAKKMISLVGKQVKLRDLMDRDFSGCKKIHIDEISEFVKKHNLIDGRQPEVFEYFYDNYCRVSFEEFVAWDNVNFDIKATDELLAEICKDDYMPLEYVSVNTLPYAGYPWNIYLLAQYLYVGSKQHSKLFYWKTASRPTTKNGQNGVMIRRSSQLSKFEDIWLDYLRKENCRTYEQGIEILNNSKIITLLTPNIKKLLERQFGKKGE